MTSTHALLAQRLHGVAQAAARGGVAGQRAGALIAVLVAVFGNVGQVQKVAEGARHRIRVIALQALDALLQQLAVRLIAFATKFHRRAAQRFDGVKDTLAFAFFNNSA